MITDGRKVLYSMKDGKLVYPEIPTEGLVCYLDARGWGRQTMINTKERLRKK